MHRPDDPDPDLDPLERVAAALERLATAAERQATALECQAGVATANRKRAATKARKRRVPTDAPVDDLSRKRARAMLRNSGFRVDGDE